MNSAGPSAFDIQSHLYSSFLQASTFDVSIRVKGTWTALYRLHRVVLIQSGFFRSLFTSGFSESSLRRNHATEELEVVFDDHNITRPAFEICIARLYGGGPVLHVSPNLIPTSKYPLTPPFSGVMEKEEVPSGHHLTSPHLLLSLLATSIYLSIPSVASQALALILKSVGPKTILPYLNFALGNPISQEMEDLQSAAGLENVAYMESDSSNGSTSSLIDTSLKHSESLSGAAGQRITGASDSNFRSTDSVISGDYDLSDEELPSYHYGGISDRIGEACTCWLARWSLDMLRYEACDQEDDESDRQKGKQRSMSFSSLFDRPGNYIAPVTDQRLGIFSRGCLTAKWIAALVSSDTLFVRSERERYNFARTVAEMRRKQGGILESEEKIWEAMFEGSIYYANMTFDDIFFISQDVSPTTGKTFSPLAVLQAAQWTHSILRHYVTSKSGGTPPSSPPMMSPLLSRDKDLALAYTTAEILGKISDGNPSGITAIQRSKSYFPVFGDSSLRIGDSGIFSSQTSPPSMEQLFNPSHALNNTTVTSSHSKVSREKARTTPAVNVSTGESAFFGLLSPKYDAAKCIEADPSGKIQWSAFPPFRFSVEFWDVDLLKEKSRLHSHTIWYAGSLFNVYVQTVRKKGQMQLGIYLHRQSHVDPIPAASAPSINLNSPPAKVTAGSTLANKPSSERSIQVASPTPTSQRPLHYSPSIHPTGGHRLNSTLSISPPQHGRPSSPPSPPASPQSSASGASSYLSSPSTSPPLAPIQPYRDPRPSISAYFSITTASPTGSSQTRFSSCPDVFSVGQSWGWKSSTLKGDEPVEIGSQPITLQGLSKGREVSLRATIVVGLV